MNPFTHQKPDIQRIVLSGCSGGGKSTLLKELGRRGYAVQPEPGRQIVKEQMRTGGNALPWTDTAAFAERCTVRAIEQFNRAASQSGPALFDRSIIDALSGLEHAGLPVPVSLHEAARKHRYAPDVFMAPPWPEIFVTDEERPKSFEEALSEVQTLEKTYERCGYRLILVPRMSVEKRADFLEAHF